MCDLYPMPRPAQGGRPGDGAVAQGGAALPRRRTGAQIVGARTASRPPRDCSGGRLARRLRSRGFRRTTLRPTVVPIFAATLAVALAACQSTPTAKTEPLDGNWAADDGSFIASFNNGTFSSRLISTGETVVTDGSYTRTPTGFSLTWTSIAANEPRSANCTFTTSDKIACEPSAGQKFTMTRVA
jgi:hypothetical protein